jgi:protein-glutamine gamma-glutamyltransferase
MASRLTSLFTVILGFLLVPAPFAWSEEIQRPVLEAKDIEPLLRTDWYGLYLKDKKIGYFRTTRDRAGDFFRESETFSIKLSSFGQRSEILYNQIATFENKPPYRMVRAEMDQQSNPVPPEKILLVRKDKGFEYSYRTGVESSRKQIADIDYTLADAMASDLWIRRGPKEGEKALFKHFDVKDGKIYTLASKVLGTKSSLVAGVNVRYFEVENESSKEMLRFLTRHDDQGRTLSSVIAIFDLRLETEEQAKNTEYSQDLFVLGMVKSDRPLGRTKNVTELVIQIDGKEGEIFEDGPRQQVTPGPNGSWLLKLGKKYGKETPATKKEIAECLEETNSYCISHPKVKALAEQAVGDAKTPEEKVRRIVNFVNGFVRPSLSATIPTIHDLMDKKQGDCKSYALLVTNLARASGVPAREVSGLLYIGDDQKAFGGHGWNEVVLNGVWVPVDATLRETEVDATHVSFGTEYKAAKNLLTTLGKLSFKVVEVKVTK